MQRFAIEPLKEFIVGVFRRAGVREDVADLTGTGLVNASARGTDSHGIRLFPHYVRAVDGGRVNKSPDYRFDQTSPSTGRFDADHTFGHAAGIEAMRRAMHLAKGAGTGHVAVYNSSHNGAMSYYSLEAAEQGFIGMSCTHATSLMQTPGSNRPFFGTNPLSMAAPIEGEGPFCFDSAPTKITWNKVKQLKETNSQAPPQSGADASGRETTDPNEMTQLLPIGDYKGFGLTMMVDILCAMLTGMPAGKDISSMYGNPISDKRYLGQFYSALRIDVFQDPVVFKQRMKKLVTDARNEPRKKGVEQIMVPGDPEKIALADREKNGIPVEEYLVRDFQDIGKKFKMTFPRNL